MKKSRKGSSSKSGQMESLHVTFAEHADQYVINSDSGIFLANDDVITDPSARNQQQVNRSNCDKMQNNNRPVRPILKLQKCVSVESQDNPFLMDGELMKKADYIINNSTISRKRIRIADPDQVKSKTLPLATIQPTPELESAEIVKITEPELGAMTYLCSDDVTIMDICSSDSNRDQSSTEDVRSDGTIDRSPPLPRIYETQNSRPFIEICNDAKAVPSNAHDRLLPNLSSFDEEPLATDLLETSTTRPLLLHDAGVVKDAQQPLMSAHKVNGDSLQMRKNGSKSPEISTISKSSATSRVKKKKKCCLLQ